MPVVFKVEPFADFQEEWLGEISRRHWEELAMDKESIPIDVNLEQYKDMDQRGILHVLTARDGKKLVGYYIAMIVIHPHYQSFGPMAMTDIYYLSPEYRKGTIAFEMMAELEKSLKIRGVKKAYSSCKAHKDLTPLFQKCGWRLTDICFTKMIEA